MQKDPSASLNRDNQAAVRQLMQTIRGRVILPGDTGYDAARAVYYRWIDRRPALLVRAADEKDVARVVTFARDQGFELAVRSGGHSIAGHSMSEGGIVLDLSDMRALEVEPATRTAWAEAGMTTGEYTNATAAYRLATGFGDTGSVGIGGITLGGGVGFLVRKYGLTIDDLLAAEIVTADGSLLRVDANNHPDLFWAIRGGGGNFGVATRFRFRLHEVDRILGGILILPATADVLRSFFEESEAAPEELSAITAVMRAPAMPFVPQEHLGRMILMAMMVYAGDPEAGERAVAPFRRLAKPVADMLRPMTYPEMYQGDGPHPAAAAVRSMFIDTVDLQRAGLILDHIQASTAPMSVAQLRVLGGAMARVPSHATAFAHRTRRIMVNVATLYGRREEAEVHEEWATRFASDLRRDDTGVYVNFLGNEGPSRVRDAYPGSTWDRLSEIKSRYDPSNVFRGNHNIPPGRDNPG